MNREKLAQTLEEAQTVDCRKCAYYGLKGCVDSDAYLECKGPGADPWGGLWLEKLEESEPEPRSPWR